MRWLLLIPGGWRLFTRALKTTKHGRYHGQSSTQDQSMVLRLKVAAHVSPPVVAAVRGVIAQRKVAVGVVFAFGEKRNQPHITGINHKGHGEGRSGRGERRGEEGAGRRGISPPQSANDIYRRSKFRQMKKYGMFPLHVSLHWKAGPESQQTSDMRRPFVTGVTLCIM